MDPGGFLKKHKRAQVEAQKGLKKENWAKTQEAWATRREEKEEHKAEKKNKLTATRKENAERVEAEKQDNRQKRDDEKVALRFSLLDSPKGKVRAKAMKSVLTAKHSNKKRDKVRGFYAQELLIMLDNNERAIEAHERAARGELSAGRTSG
jgi:hypothetical protein